jgi:large subunit ribosomal protein LP2
MKHVASYLLLVLGGNASPSADDVTKALSSVGVEADSESLNKLISELEGKDLDELLASGSELLAKFGGGGGGGGGGGAGGAAAAEEEKEEVKKEEEEEMDLGGGGMSMFGEEEGAGGGDY